MKKNILLTIWLLLPITIVSLLMVWIFYSLDKDRLMADAVPIGAGAGDTGNANALGQWLAGRNPDAISDALAARRAGIAIDPREWPGGVLLYIPMEYIGDQTRAFVFHIDQAEQDAVEYVTVYVKPNEDGEYDLPLEQWQITGGTFGIMNRDVQNKMYIFPLILPETVPHQALQVSEPLIVHVTVDPLYQGGLP